MTKNVWSRRLKSILLIFIVLLFGLASTGCSKKAAVGTKTIIVWGFDDPDVFKPIIRDFEKKYTGNKINYVQKSLDDDYELNSLNAIAAGKGPDVWTIPNTWMVKHADKVAPAPAYKASKDELGKIDPMKYFLPSVLNAVVNDNKIYGLTPAIDTLRVYYNPVLAEAAKTEFEKLNKSNADYRRQIVNTLDRGPLFWEDIIAIKKAFDGNSNKTPFIALGTSNNVQVSNDILYLLMLQNKTKVFSDDGQTAIFNLPVQKATGESVTPGTKALEFYTSFANPASENYTWDANKKSDVEAFVNGEVMAVVNYRSFSEYINQRFPTFKYKSWPMPQIMTSSNQEVTDFARFNLMTVPTLSKNQTSAWTFIKHACTVGQITYTTATKRVSSKAVTDEEKAPLTERVGADAIDKLQKQTSATLRQRSRFPVSFNDVFSEAIKNVNESRVSPQQSMDVAADKITQLLRNTSY